MRKLILIVLLHVACVHHSRVCAQTPSCGAGSLDLSKEFSADLQTLTFDGPNNFQFSVTPCDNAAEPCRPGNGRSTVHTYLNGSCSWVMARYGDGSWSVSGDNDDVKDGVSVRYQNGDVAWGCSATNNAPVVTLNFVCEGELAAKEEENDCDYTITIPSKSVCEAAAPPPSEPTTKGLSGGWVFVIILLVTFSVYMIGGIIYNTQRKGEKGVEAIPNISFWRSLPGLVSDGWSFTLSKFSGKSVVDDSYNGALIPDQN